MEYCLGGGNGLISVTADVAPREMSELVQACRSGDREAAESINNKVSQAPGLARAYVFLLVSIDGANRQTIVGASK